MATLAEIARQTDEVTARARAELVGAVRAAAAKGMPQTEIARQIGRSQPEVSRLLRFHSSSPSGMALRRHASQIRKLVGAAGGQRVRVFGSLATGQDRPDSDVDLLFEMTKPLSLMDLARLENQIADLLERKVDLVPESSLHPAARDRIVSEAVLL